jgi:hypothetical protein
LPSIRQPTNMLSVIVVMVDGDKLRPFTHDFVPA